MTASMLMSDWALEFHNAQHQYKIITGGRSSGKSEAVAQSFVLRMLTDTPGHQFYMCLREYERNTARSLKSMIEQVIRRSGLAHEFDVLRTEIVCKRNRNTAFFVGMERNPDNIRSYTPIRLAWVEEAHDISDQSWTVLLPTVRGDDNAQIWVTMNPHSDDNPIWRSLIEVQRENVYHRHRNFDTNPFQPTVMESLRRDTQRYDPDRYAHIWLGELAPNADQMFVLPRQLVLKCIDAHKELPNLDLRTGATFAGLDVADTGADRTALVVRTGPLIEFVDMFSLVSGRDIFRRVDRTCVDRGVVDLAYDAAGVGAKVRDAIADYKTSDYRVVPIQFGGKVGGPNKVFSGRQTNAEAFAYFNAQMAWGLKLRAENTARLLDGEDVDPMKCLFVNSDGVPQLDAFVSDLAQPLYTHRDNDRIHIDKRGDRKDHSPDGFDGTCLAFSYDAVYGMSVSDYR